MKIMADGGAKQQFCATKEVDSAVPAAGSLASAIFHAFTLSRLFMTTLMQTLTDQLTMSIVPSYAPGATAPGHTPKGVAKALKQLAKQLAKQQARHEYAAQKIDTPTAKMQRKALAGELLTALRPQLGLNTATSTKAPKSIAKTVSRLAAKLIAQRRKEAGQVAKATRKAAKKLQKEETLAPVLQMVRRAPASNGRPAPAARLSRAKPATSNGALATDAAKK